VHGSLAVPSGARVSQLEQAVWREGLVLASACVEHGRADCGVCVADVVRRLSALVGV
jgi:hypothetical protein